MQQPGYRDLESQPHAPIESFHDRTLDPGERDLYTWLRHTEPQDDRNTRNQRSFTYARKADTMTYQANTLTNWQALFMFHGTIWDNPSLWFSIGCTLALSGVFAVITFAIVQDPGALKAGKFSRVG